MSRGSSTESPGRRVHMIFLAYCIVILCICVVSCPYVIYYPAVMVQYSLFVLKVPLNPKQTNICTMHDACCTVSAIRR